MYILQFIFQPPISGWYFSTFWWQCKTAHECVLETQTFHKSKPNFLLKYPNTLILAALREVPSTLSLSVPLYNGFEASVGPVVQRHELISDKLWALNLGFDMKEYVYAASVHHIKKNNPAACSA